MTKIYTSNAPAPKLDTIKETVLKRRKTANKDVIRLQLEKAKNVRIQAKKRSSKIKTSAGFIIDAKKRHYDNMRIKNSKRNTPIFLSDTPKLGVVIRLGGFNGLSVKSENILKSLRLDTFNQAVFVKVDQRMLRKLNIIKPYIAWGYPSAEVVNDLLAKRGWAKINEARIKITKNTQIEDHLGKYNVLCVADVVHELINVGENFDVVNDFIWPFKLLSAPPGWLGLGNKRKHLSHEPGSRDLYINDLLKRMI